MVTAAMKLKDAYSLEEKLWPWEAETLFCQQSPSSQGYGFSSGHVWMWELDCEESWAPKNWCFWTVVLEKTLQSPLDCKEIQPVHSEGDQPWDFFGRNDAKAEAPVLWPPHAKSWLIGKDPDAGRGWGQEEKGTTQDETAGWHHGLDGRGSEWTLGAGDGQGGLACCDSWGGKESNTTEQLNWADGLYNNNKEKKTLNIRNKRQTYHRVKMRKISKDKKTEVNFFFFNLNLIISVGG